jgi:multidrug efflux pump subunit AcrB
MNNPYIQSWRRPYMLSLLLSLVIVPVLAVKVLDEEAKAEWSKAPLYWEEPPLDDFTPSGWKDDEQSRWKDLVALGMGEAWTWGPYDETASIHSLRVFYGV